jgi:hypothetical protein
MPDKLVCKTDPVFPGNHSLQILLDFAWFGILGQIEAAGKAEYVGIHYDAGCNSVSRAQHYVGGFARDAREREQFFHRFRHLPAEIFQDLSAGAHDGFRFVTEKTCGANGRFQFCGIGEGEVFRSGISRKKYSGHLIDAHVGALRGEDGRNQQLKRILVYQRAGRFGVGFIQFVEDGADPARVSAPDSRTPRARRRFRRFTSCLGKRSFARGHKGGNYNTLAIGLCVRFGAGCISRFALTAHGTCGRGQWPCGLLGVRLPQADDVAIRVGQPGKVARVGNFRGRHQRFSA